MLDSKYVKKRRLTSDELHSISIETDMLSGNINRMCISEDFDEFIKMFNFAIKRINTICSICSNKFLNNNESEDI